MELPPILHNFLMVISFVLGCLFGSFANVCICRWPAGQSVVSPRSRCPSCGNAISGFDNIPILSWLILGAKCRYCAQPISWQYPLVEALGGLLFLAVYLKFGITVATPVYMALCLGLIIITFVDLAEWIIPNEVTFTGIPAGLAISLVGLFYEGSGLRVTHPFDALLGILLGGGILYLLDKLTLLLLKKPGMGFGDVKLLAMLGAFLGWKGVIGTLMLACVIGSIVGVSLILRERFSTRDAQGQEAQQAVADGGGEPEFEGHYLPFGPYLAVSGLIFLFTGPELLEWYLQYLEIPAAAPALLP